MSAGEFGLIRGLYDYHRWANRRLFDVAAALGEELASRDAGSQFSFPTLTRMFGHLYGADWLWLSRWKGASPTQLPGAEFKTLAAVRAAWDGLEREQRAFVESLTPADLARIVEYRNTAGRRFRLALGPLLLHVANHATHHRSEIATMLTMLSGSPPDTGINSYLVLTTGQG
ncbi:MAG: DinB family protein [Candidatus Rokubacteria bacterium]|nr:DinB family protein [Candidatus Rokubacteria bacterium]